MTRLQAVPLGRLDEYVDALKVDKSRIMYRKASHDPLDFDVIVKVASCPQYVRNVLDKQEMGASNCMHWRAYSKA